MGKAEGVLEGPRAGSATLVGSWRACEQLRAKWTYITFPCPKQGEEGKQLPPIDTHGSAWVWVRAGGSSRTPQGRHEGNAAYLAGSSSWFRELLGLCLFPSPLHRTLEASWSHRCLRVEWIFSIRA